MSELLTGKIAVVTGGAAGIGGGVTRRLAAAGATVVVNDIDGELLEAAVAAVESTGGRAIPVLGDIRDAAAVEELASAALAVDGERVDVLVNNVGDYRPNGYFLSTTEDEWQQLYAINLEHVFRCTHALAPAMQARAAREASSTSRRSRRFAGFPTTRCTPPSTPA